MKILHIITALNFGGAENMLAKLMEQGGADDHEVLSLLPPGPAASRIAACGIRVHSLGMRRGMAGPWSILRLRQLVEDIAPDLIHGWMYHGNLAASFARRFCTRSLPLVWNIRHSIPDLAMESWQTRQLLKVSAWISNGPQAIIYNAYASREQHEALGYSSRDGLVLPNGFDTERFAPDPDARKLAEALFGFSDRTFRIACVARFHPMKDQMRLLSAVSDARAKGADIQLLLVGHGFENPPPEIAAPIADHMSPDSVLMCGARSDVADWLPGIDLLVLPSAWGEGFPNVLGEALACGVPVVATDVGDSARIVGHHGLVVPRKDTGALTQALLAMAALPACERAAMGRAGRKRIVSDYAIGSVAAHYNTLHAACLEDWQRSKRTGPVTGRLSNFR
ncbi:glycosyltransferase [Qipengyuania sp. NPDC077563]|uniref:glycosyltransferase n=1 Tax=Qipengyuania sp. NPDC077563 TaxID=3364497 RepID=UPI00384F7B43